MRAALAATAALAVLALASCGDDRPDSTTTSTSFTATTAAPTTASTTGSGAASGAGGGGGSGAASGAGGGGAPPRSEAVRSAELPRSVDSVIAAVLTGSEAPEAICDQLVTAAYVRTAYGDRQGCVAAQRPGTLAKSVQVSQIEESGETATAVAVPSGGPYSGVDVDVKLAADPDVDGAWRVDSLQANVPAGP